MTKHQMTHLEAHELVNADRGVHIVATTLAITYVGWFQSARQGVDGWVRVVLDSFDGIRTTLLLPARMHVHIEPFPTLIVGELVVRRGFDDPDHRNYRRPDLGQVERVARRQTDQGRVYLVRWEREPEVTWYTRRMLQHATAADVAQIRSAVTR